MYSCGNNLVSVVVCVIIVVVIIYFVMRFIGKRYRSQDNFMVKDRRRRKISGPLKRRS